MTKPDKEFIKLPEDRVLSLSEIIDSVKNNYAISLKNLIQLESLQEWVGKQQEVMKK